MGKLLSEPMVLKALDITDFCQLTKEKIPKMLSMIDKMEPEVAKKALEQFPYFSDAMKDLLHDYQESLNKAYESNASSVEAFYHSCNTMIEALQKKLEQDGFSFDETRYIIEKMQEIIEMMNKKDSENKTFLGVIGAFGFLAVVGVGTALATVLGGNLGGSDNNDSTSTNHS